MQLELTGGCACGAIRYRTGSAPEFSIICQCRQCQRISGSGHSAAFAVNAETTTVQGNVVYYELKADSGATTRSGFCGICGSPVLKKPSAYPQYIMFHAATLDEPGLFQPDMVVYSKFGQAWDHVDKELPRK